MKYIFNKNKEILKKLKEMFEKSIKIDISVSFITFGGFQLFKDVIKDKKIRIITTTDQGITDPNSLASLLKVTKDLKVIDSFSNDHNYLKSWKLFHTKFILFHTKNGELYVYNGSLNLTTKALNQNYEFSTLEKVNTVESLQLFESLWKEAELVDKKFIEIYKKRHNLNKFISISEIKNLTPNEMQKTALKNIDNLIKNGKNKAFVHAATGTGKTFLSAFVAKEQNFKRILFIVHLNTIKEKSMETFDRVFKSGFSSELNSSTHKILSGIKNETFCYFSTPVKVINSLIKNKIDQNLFDYIIIDEAHHFNEENTYSKIANYFKPKLLLGMTATPERTNGTNVEKFFGNETIYKMDLSESLRRGYLSDFNYFGIYDSKIIGDNYITKKNSDIKAQNIIEQIKKWGYKGEKLKALIFVGRQLNINSNNNNEEDINDINQAELISNSLNKFGYKTEAIYSKKFSKDDVSFYIKRLENNDTNLNILVSINMFNEGLDIPSLNLIVMMRKTQSKIIWLQQLGRGLRKLDDKELTIFDFIGNDENEYKRLIDTKTEIRPPMEIINSIFEEKIIDSPGGLITLERKSLEQLLIKFVNNSRPYNWINNLLSKINESQRIDSLSYKELEYRGLNPLEVSHFSKTGSLASEIAIVLNINLSNEESIFLKLINSIPLNIFSYYEKIEIVKILEGKKGFFSNIKILRLLKGEYNGYSFQEYFTFKDNFFIFKESLNFSKFVLEQIKKFNSYLIELKNFNRQWIIGEKYSKQEIVFMMKNDFGGLTLQQGQYNLGLKEENEIVLFNTLLPKEKNQNLSFNRVNDSQLICNTKQATKDEEIIKLKNNEIFIHNFIKVEKFSEKFDGDRFIYLGKIIDYKIGKKHIKNNYEVLFDLDILNKLDPRLIEIVRVLQSQYLI